MSTGYTSSARLAIPVSAYAQIKAADFGGAQASLPAISGTSATYYLIVPNSASQFKTQKSTHVIYPDGIAETAGIAVAGLDCVAPARQNSHGYTQGQSQYIVVGNVLYLCTGTGTSAASAPTFATAKGATTVDGSATFTSKGRAILVRVQFVNASGGSATPASREYDIYQL